MGLVATLYTYHVLGGVDSTLMSFSTSCAVRRTHLVKLGIVFCLSSALLGKKLEIWLKRSKRDSTLYSESGPLKVATFHPIMFHFSTEFHVCL